MERGHFRSSGTTWRRRRMLPEEPAATDAEVGSPPPIHRTVRWVRKVVNFHQLLKMTASMFLRLPFSSGG